MTPAPSELRTGERARIEGETKPPHGAAARPSGTRPAVLTPRPVLASECLRDDVAPIEPWSASASRWYVALGVAVVVASGATAVRGGTVVGAALGVGAGAAMIGSIAVPKYAARAAVALFAALALVGCAIASLGPLAAWGASPSHLYRWGAPVLLAATLFVRATYRAHRAILVPLLLGVIAFLAAASVAGGQLVWLADASLASRIVAGAMGIAALLALLGFMGAETTAGCVAWGAGALVTSAASFAVEGVDARSILTALVAALSSAVAAIALFQLAATWIGPRARAVSRISVPAAPVDDEPPSEAS